MDFLNTELMTQYKDMLGADMYQQTVDLYEQQSQNYLTKLSDAVEQQDYDHWKDSCHILKSASGNLGLKKVFEKVAELEYSKQDFAILATELDALKVLNNASMVALKEWLNQD
ncbi:Hpt domain-containing protein [Thalassotalea aquiviva]|uniref:Hpt domain-containing protein n=1 Tax=Thalassotalea aquiviva TaxID=3242415 RepID=UPI00352B6622